MGKSFWANFSRKMIRADYRLDDRLFGSVSHENADGKGARLYLQEDKEGRSKYIGDRAIYLVNNSIAALIAGSLLIQAIGHALSTLSSNSWPSDLFGIVLLFLVWYLFAWFALKSHSWLRWMVRNWNASIMAPRPGRSPRNRRRRNRRISGAPRSRPGVPKVRLVDVLDIARTWFRSEFIRKHIKADYRAGDHVFLGYFWGPGWQYPQEYLCDGKTGRLIMIVTRLLPLGLALWGLYLTGPWVIWRGLIPISYVLLPVMYAIALWLILISQSFLRWMFRNWNSSPA